MSYLESSFIFYNKGEGEREEEEELKIEQLKNKTIIDLEEIGEPSIKVNLKKESNKLLHYIWIIKSKGKEIWSSFPIPLTSESLLQLYTFFIELYTIKLKQTELQKNILWLPPPYSFNYFLDSFITIGIESMGRSSVRLWQAGVGLIDAEEMENNSERYIKNDNMIINYNNNTVSESIYTWLIAPFEYPEKLYSSGVFDRSTLACDFYQSFHITIESLWLKKLETEIVFDKQQEKQYLYIIEQRNRLLDLLDFFKRVKQ